MSDPHTALDDLRTSYGDELLTVNEFAELLGVSDSWAAQLRAARKTDADFPAVVVQSGRSFMHRLSDLIDWLEPSRFATSARLDGDRFAAWRLDRLVRQVAERAGPDNARRMLAAAALSEPLDDPIRSQVTERQELAAALLDGIDHERDLELIRSELRRTAPGAVDQLLGELGSNQPGVARSTPEPVALLAALLLDSGADNTIYEPTAGECETLLQVASLAAATGQSPIRISGSDLDSDTLTIGATRLALHGVTAELGTDTKPAPGSVDRMIIDPGGGIDRRTLATWVRLLHRDGRIVMLTRLPDAADMLTAELWPTTIVVPPQRTVAGRSVHALWCSEPFSERRSTVTLIDLRSNQDDPGGTRSRTEALLRAAELDLPLSDIIFDAGWRRRLDQAIPNQPIIHRADAIDLDADLARLIDGTLGVDPAVLDDNRSYGLLLARELVRLTSGDSDDQFSLTDWRPEPSPDGILQPLASNEVRRALARLVDALTEGP